MTVLVDESLLTELVDDLGAAGLARLIDVFVRDVDRKLALLAAAAARDDSTACHEMAHALAGSAASIGAISLADAARSAMVHAVSAGTTPVHLIATIADGAAATKLALAAHQASLRGAAP